MLCYYSTVITNSQPHIRQFHVNSDARRRNPTTVGFWRMKVPQIVVVVMTSTSKNLQILSPRGPRSTSIKRAEERIGPPPGSSTSRIPTFVASPAASPVHDFGVSTVLARCSTSTWTSSSPTPARRVPLLRDAAPRPFQENIAFLQCGVERKRFRAMIDQIPSTTPKGHAPARNPYTLDSTHPNANAAMKLRPRFSRAYISIMKLSATTP